MINSTATPTREDAPKPPLIMARDIYVDDVTSDMPILRIEMPDGAPDYAVRLAPCACRALGIALTAAADIAERDRIASRLDEIRLAVGRIADQVAASGDLDQVLRTENRTFDPAVRQAGGAR